MLRIPFSWLSDRQFELLCRDLAEDEFVGYELHCYGERGHSQAGVDIVGRSRHNGDMIVLECKAYKQFSHEILEKSLERFQKYAEQWKKKGVSCFILCMACDPSTPKHVDMIFERSRYLEEIGISFCLWSKTGIEYKLSKRPWIVHRYFPDCTFGQKINKIDASESRTLRYIGGTRSERKIFALLDSFGIDAFSEVVSNEDPAFAPELENLCIESCSKALGKGLTQLKTGISICEDLIESGIHSKSWKYRRIFSKVLSNIFENSRADDRYRLTELLERALGSTDGAISVSAGLTVNRRSAKAVPIEILKKLLNHRHPQVRWQMLREWSLFADQLDDNQDRMIKMAILNSNDHWTRRRLIISLLVQDGKNGFKNVINRNIYKELLNAELAISTGEAFIETVRDWIWTSFGEAGCQILPLPSNTSTNYGVFLREANEPLRIARYIGVQCMRLDDDTFRRVEELKLLNRSEGRYGVIREWVRNALGSVPTGQSSDLAMRLLEQHDEGIRWAVGVLMPLISTSTDRDAVAAITRKLMTDEHPWIVREGLEFLAKDEAILSRKQNEEMIQIAGGKILYFNQHGWEESEFKDQFLRAWARFPNSISLRSLPL